MFVQEEVLAVGACGAVPCDSWGPIRFLGPCRNRYERARSIRDWMQLPPSDVPVLRELLSWGAENFPRGNLNVSVQAIAGKTGLHRNTVQRRMEALQKGGVVEGYLFEPHPHAVGLVRSGHLFEGVDVPDAGRLAERLEPFPGVSIAALHLESVFLHTWHGSSAAVDADVAALQGALDADAVYPSFRSDRWPPSPAKGLRLSGLDRLIMVALRRGTRRSVSQIAREVGATRRTVARRIDRLVEAGAGAMLPVFRPSRIQGKVIAVFESLKRSRSVMEALRREFPDRIMGPVDTGRVMVMVPMEGLDEAARRQAEVIERTPLLDLEMRFMRDCLFPMACDDWLRERVQNAPPLEHNR